MRVERMERDGDFLARHLNDTRYLSRTAREIMAHVCRDVWVVPGAMTAMLRARWGLNSILPTANLDAAYGPDGEFRKNRLDHRHHAIDAVVVGLTDRGLLNRIARANAREDLDGIEIPEPEGWGDIRDRVRDAVVAINVSHKRDRRLPSGTARPGAGRFRRRASSTTKRLTAWHRRPMPTAMSRSCRERASMR